MSRRIDDASSPAKGAVQVDSWFADAGPVNAAAGAAARIADSKTSHSAVKAAYVHAPGEDTTLV